MAHTIESAFDHEHVRDVLQLLSEYRFTLGDLHTVITIRLYRAINGAPGVFFRQSHFISTPTQAAPYRTSRPWNDTEASAINQVVSAMNEHYSDALRVGKTPDDSWLTLDESF